MTVSNTFSPNTKIKSASMNTNFGEVYPHGGFVGFRAYIDAGEQQSVANSASINIIYPTENYDIDGNYNAGTGVFTAPVNGYYHFDASIMFESIAWTDGEYAYITLLLDGASAISANRTVIQSAETMLLIVKSTIDYYLTAGQTINIRAVQTSGAAINTYTGTQYCYFSGHLISRT